MPNYLYKCCECKEIVDLTLPISTDPKELFTCPCGYTMKRIMRAPGAFKGFKVYAGDWFKKTYGHDLRTPYEDKVRQQEDRKTLEKEARKKNGI